MAARAAPTAALVNLLRLGVDPDLLGQEHGSILLEIEDDQSQWQITLRRGLLIISAMGTDRGRPDATCSRQQLIQASLEGHSWRALTWCHHCPSWWL